MILRFPSSDLILRYLNGQPHPSPHATQTNADLISHGEVVYSRPGILAPCPQIDVSYRNRLVNTGDPSTSNSADRGCCLPFIDPCPDERSKRLDGGHECTAPQEMKADLLSSPGMLGHNTKCESLWPPCSRNKGRLFVIAVGKASPLTDVS